MTGGLPAIVASAIVTFPATNIDDLVILTFFFGAGNPARRVLAGQYLEFGAIVAVSAAVGAGAHALSPEAVGLLGLVPLFLGIRGLVRLWKRQGDEDAPVLSQTSVLSIAAVTLLVAVWCALARAFVRVPKVAQVFARWGERAAPLVLVALGMAILLSAGSLSLLTRLAAR